MNASPIADTLILLSDLIQPVKGEWIIIGSASLYLNDMVASPNDIDILCDNDSAVEIENLLKAYRIEEMPLKDSDKFKSRFSRYKINNIIIELMGDLQVNSITGWQFVLPLIHLKQSIIRGGSVFTIPSDNDNLKIYELFGRKKDKAIIRKLKDKMGFS